MARADGGPFRMDSMAGADREIGNEGPSRPHEGAQTAPTRGGDSTERRSDSNVEGGSTPFPNAKALQAPARFEQRIVVI